MCGWLVWASGPVGSAVGTHIIIEHPCTEEGGGQERKVCKAID